jgi:hypothetical protein
MPLEWLCHSTKCQINKYLLDYINNFMSLSCKNITRLLSVTVWWVVILVHEVANLLRFDTTSLDGWFPTFQRIIMVSTSGWSSPRHYNFFFFGGGRGGVGVVLVGLNVTMSLATRTLLWELQSHTLLHIWEGLCPSQHRYLVSWLHLFMGFFTASSRS